MAKQTDMPDPSEWFWRQEFGPHIGQRYTDDEILRKYKEAMAEKRAWQAKQQATDVEAKTD